MIFLKISFFSVFIPPISGIIEGEGTFFYEIRILGCEFFCILAMASVPGGRAVACNDAEEGQIALDVFAPSVLTQAEAKDLIKLCFRLG